MGTFGLLFAESWLSWWVPAAALLGLAAIMLWWFAFADTVQRRRRTSARLMAISGTLKERPESRTELADLRRALASSYVFERCCALFALESIYQDYRRRGSTAALESLLPEFVAALRSRDPFVRNAGAQSLARIGSDPPVAAPDLAETLRQFPYEGAGMYAAIVLRNLGDRSATVLDALRTVGSKPQSLAFEEAQKTYHALTGWPLPAGVSERTEGVTVPGGEKRKSWRGPSGLVPLLKPLIVVATCVTVFGLLLSAVQSIRQAASRTNYDLSFKQIALAINNYESEHQALPPLGTTAKDGQRGLSWRVLILPELDRNDLFRKFRLDEPWDSAHNRTLIPEIPKEFIGADPLTRGKTRILAPVGSNTLWGERGGIRLGIVRSQTILLVECADENAVEWTRPEDLTINPEAPWRGLRRQPPDQRVAFGSGEIRHLRLDLDNQTLRNLFLRSGQVGE